MLNYTLTVRTQTVAVRLDLNGVPRWIRPGRPSDGLSANVNPWIMPGTNTLRLGIDWPDGVSYEPGRASLELRLDARPRTAATGGRVLAACEWPGRDEEAYPAALTLAFEVTQAPPSRLWHSAAPIALTPQARDEIRTLVAHLHAALAERNIDRACELLDYRTVDVTQTLYQPAQEARAAQRAVLEALPATDGATALLPLHPDELELHPVADSRVVWVTRPDRAPAIEQHTADGALAMPLYVARIDNAWKIVR